MKDDAYKLEAQIGFILRQASQRHTNIFANRIPDGLTPAQFSALAKLHEKGPISQNELGRQTAMDVATIKGVVDRLADRGLVRTERDAGDRRRLSVALADAGEALIRKAIPRAREITEETLKPLNRDERTTILHLLRKLCLRQAS